MVYKNVIGRKLIEFKKVESTNKTSLELQQEEILLDGTVIRAYEQSSGKGQETNQWESEKGKNLTISVVLYPFFIEPARQFLINIFISLSVMDLVSELLPGKNVKIKWPNDIYVDKKKVAGILINNTIKGNSFDYSVIGIGININQEVFKSDASNPVSVKNILGKKIGRELLLARLLGVFEKEYLYFSRTNDFNAVFKKIEKILI